jgi:Ulp1 family protease
VDIFSKDVVFVPVNEQYVFLASISYGARPFIEVLAGVLGYLIEEQIVVGQF